MGKTYDNWERLVTSVVRREQQRELALKHSRTPSSISSCSESISISSSAAANFNYTYTPSTSRILPHKSLVYGWLKNNYKLPAASFNATNQSEEDNLSCFVDKTNGVKCYMVGARGLLIISPDSSQGWKWTSHPDSRFLEVAEFQAIWWLDIRCKVRAKALPQRTTYTAYLVYKLAERYKGLGSAKSTVRYVDDDSDRDAEKRAQIVQLQHVEDRRGRVVAVSRADEWMELELGSFYICQGDEGYLEVRLFETSKYVVKTGLIVLGIQFRSLVTCKKTPLISKQCMSRIVMA